MYLIISIIISLTLTSAVQKNTEQTKSITLQATGKSVGSTTLKHSADIISARLKLYGLSSFEVKVLSDKGELILLLPDKISISEIEGLITLKGEVAFYETFERNEIAGLFGSDNQLFKLLSTIQEQKPSDPRLGCSLSENRNKVDEYLLSCKSAGNCKFVWGSESKKSGYCLFALKTEVGGKALLERSDLDSVKIVKSKDSEERKIQIRLKPAATGIFAEATKNNLNKAIAIVIDDCVYSWPVVKSTIYKGEIEVTGSFDEKEAAYLPVIFNSEQLPSGFKILN
jgi:preprotein translocase subunit SecD